MILTVASIVFVVLVTLSIFSTNQFIQKQNTTDLLDKWISWLETHSARVTATVTLAGVVVTIIIFVLQQHINHIKELKNSLKQLFDFYYDLYFESIDRKSLLKNPKIDEEGIEIFDFEFPNEIYPNVPYDIQRGTYRQSGTIIRTYYHTLKIRNKLYDYRIKTKINNIQDYNSYVKNLIHDINQQISLHEKSLSESNDIVIEILDNNIKNIDKYKKNWKTKIGFRFGSTYY